MHARSRASLALLLVSFAGAALTLACGDPAGPRVGPLSPGLHVEGSLPADTIQALVPAPLLITLADVRGFPIANAELSIYSVPKHPSGESWAPVLLLATSDSVPLRYLLPHALTDSAGQVRLWVQYGTLAGDAQLVVSYADTSSMSVGTRDSLPVTILPGAPARFRFIPADSTAYAGRIYPLESEVLDRCDNLTAVVPTLSSSRQEVVQIDDQGGVKTIATGRAYVIATAGQARDSAAISVVPHGTVLAYQPFQSSGGAPRIFYAFDMDGSNYRPVGGSSPGFNHRSQYYFPGGDRVVLNSASALYTMDPDGSFQTLLEPAGNVHVAQFPQPSRDGEWVYFTAITGYEATAIWRVRSDGTGAAEVGLASQYQPLYSQPSPSPEGERIAVAVTTYGSAEGSLGVLNLSTNALQLIPGFAERPRWSPDADEIAYFGTGGIRIVGTDGTLLLGPVTPGQIPYDRFDGTDGQVDWSPDGKWLVACATGRYSGYRYLVLIRRADGEVLPLEHTKSRNLCGATWHPS